MELSISIPIINNGSVYLLGLLQRFFCSDLSSEELLLRTQVIQTLQRSVGTHVSGKWQLTLSMRSMEDSTSGTPTS
jgi:hypothetical protein